MSSVSFDLSGLSVFISIPLASRGLSDGFLVSLFGTCNLFRREGIKHAFSFGEGNGTEAARNMLADIFLRSDETTPTSYTHNLMIDSDTIWRPEDALRLLAIGTKLECVSAIYRQKCEPEMYCLSCEPAESNEYGCLPVKGLGLGFTCVQRSVIERMADRAPEVFFETFLPYPIKELFRASDKVPGIYEGRKVNCHRGEDMSFFADVLALGVQPWLDPHIELGHLGEKEYRGSYLEHLKRIAEAHYAGVSK